MKTESNRSETFVYVARFPFEINDNFLCTERQKDIAGASNCNVRQSKLYVWKLLEIALLKSFGLELSKLNVVKNSNGKWICDECEFSLSHSGDIVAVAVSDKPAGVDVEMLNPERFGEQMQNRILTETELTQSKLLAEKERAVYANVLFSQKEAAFKMSDCKNFVAHVIETSKYKFEVKTLQTDNTYIVSAVSSCAQKIVFNALNVELNDFVL